MKVELDLSGAVSPDYEAVRADVRRVEGGCPVSAGLLRVHIAAVVTLRPKWQWPEWLKCRWVAMDKGGRWFGYVRKPQELSCSWDPVGGEVINLRPTAFDPPPCNDWTKSLRENPEY